MTANLSSVLNDQDELLVIKNEAERMGIRILPPDVTASGEDCSIDGGAIRLGLGTIKNVGKAAQNIIEARAKKRGASTASSICARRSICGWSIKNAWNRWSVPVRSTP